MKINDSVLKFLKKTPPRIMFPEGQFKEIIATAADVARAGWGKPILVGPRTRIQAAASKHNISLENIEIKDPEFDEHLDVFVEEYLGQPGHERLLKSQVTMAFKDPLHFALLCAKNQLAEGIVFGISGSDRILEASRYLLGPAKSEDPMTQAWAFALHSGQRAVVSDAQALPELNHDKLSIFADQLSELAQSLALPSRVALLSNNDESNPWTSLVGKRQDSPFHNAPVVPISVAHNLFEAMGARDATLGSQMVKSEDPATILVYPDTFSREIFLSSLRAYAGAEIIGPIILGGLMPVCGIPARSHGDSIRTAAAIVAVEAAASAGISMDQEESIPSETKPVDESDESTSNDHFGSEEGQGESEGTP